jgi:hypothetical protein
VPPLHLAFIRTQLGEIGAAVALVARALEERNTFLWAWLRHDQSFDPLRSDPRFDTLLQQIQPE